MPLARHAALLSIIAFILNIIIPFATVVGESPLHAVAGDGYRSPAPTYVVHKDHTQPSPSHCADHGPVCPLCLLLGSQALGPCPTDIAVLPSIDAAEPSWPAAETGASPLLAARPQSARAPPGEA